MLTTENYPDASYGPTKIAQWVIIFYIFFIFFGMFVIMAIILAVNYEKFKDLKINKRNEKKQRDYESLMTESCFTTTVSLAALLTALRILACTVSQNIAFIA